MIISRLSALGVAVLAGSTLSSCKTFPKGDMAPAVLMSKNDLFVEAVKMAAAEILGMSTVTLGASDFTKSPSVSILPKRANSPTGAPFNQQDFAIPTQLLLMTDGTNCFLVKEDTRDIAQVKGVDCRAIG